MIEQPNIIQPLANKGPSKGFIICLIVIAIIVIWAVLTKTGYIPNYLKISILAAEENNSLIPVSDSSMNLKPGYGDAGGSLDLWKPVIYLYPTETTKINVKLDYDGEIIADYPKYDNTIKGWNVIASPDGKIINQADGKEYSYIFWEGNLKTPIKWDMSNGFIIKGSDTRDFLATTLSKIGLSPKEYNEFIVYWYPLMKDNKYNFIHFATTEYDRAVPLSITPKPDSVLRVFMIYKSLNSFINIKEQSISNFDRHGFTVIEWGGTNIK